jgi:hypothetical protein
MVASMLKVIAHDISQIYHPHSSFSRTNQFVSTISVFLFELPAVIPFSP